MVNHSESYALARQEEDELREQNQLNILAVYMHGSRLGVYTSITKVFLDFGLDLDRFYIHLLRPEALEPSALQELIDSQQGENQD